MARRRTQAPLSLPAAGAPQKPLPLLLLETLTDVSTSAVSGGTTVCLVNKYLKILCVAETKPSGLWCCFGAGSLGTRSYGNAG